MPPPLPCLLCRKKARQLDLALACVRDAKEAALSCTAAVPPGAAGAPPTAAAGDVAEKALRHLLLHVDADELYRVALGMYELPLAYMVIANAQVRAEERGRRRGRGE